MTNRMAICALSIMLTASPWAQGSDAARAKELMTLMRADEFAAGVLRSGMKRKQAQAGLTDAQIACVNAVPHSEFSEAVTTALAENLSDEELATAIAFFRAPAGTRYVKSLVALMQGTNPAERMTGDDVARFEEFRATSAGEKLLKQGLMSSAEVVTNRMAELSINAIDNCGKAAK